MMPEGTQYILCIDGGGSKTNLQILNTQYETVLFKKRGAIVTEYVGGSANMNAIGLSGFNAMLTDLFEEIVIENVPLEQLLSYCFVIGGFAGAAEKTRRQTMCESIRSCGFPYVTVNHDAATLFECIHGDAMVLIAGTGSICFTRKGETVLRVGGLGSLLGDEGSGYYIGKLAIKAVLEKKYNYGPETQLVPVICNRFKVDSPEKIKRLLYAGEINRAEVAALAPTVFALASDDIVAHAIIEDASAQLAQMVHMACRTLGITQCRLYLVGRLFKQEGFVQKVLEKAGVSSWSVRNMAFANPIVSILQENNLSYE